MIAVGNRNRVRALNPLLPSVPYKSHLAKILISILEGIIKKKNTMSVATMSRQMKRAYPRLCHEKRRKKRGFGWQSVRVTGYRASIIYNDWQSGQLYMQGIMLAHVKKFELLFSLELPD